MSIHSKFLVHWTGKKDIEKEENESKRRHLYVNRLYNDYRNGLYTEENDERVMESTRRRGAITVHRLVRYCFTEIR